MGSKRRVSRCLEMQQRSAERAAKAMKGEQTEDVSKWIFEWDVDHEGDAKFSEAVSSTTTIEDIGNDLVEAVKDAVDSSVKGRFSITPDGKMAKNLRDIEESGGGYDI